MVVLLSVTVGAQEVRDGFALFPRTRMLTTDDDGRLRLPDVLLLVSDTGTFIVKERTSQHVYYRFTSDEVTRLSLEDSRNPGDWSEVTSHWLYVEYHASGGPRNLVLRLDERETDGALVALEERMRVPVENLLATDLPGPLIAAKGSTDVDEIVDYPLAPIADLLPAALRKLSCQAEDDPDSLLESGTVRCTRTEFDRGASPWGPGGEKLEVQLEDVGPGAQTRVLITTDHGNRFWGWNRGKMNWSRPAFMELVRLLEHQADGRGALTPPRLRLVAATRLRAAPDETSAVVDDAAPGQVVEQLDERGSWRLVRPITERGEAERTGWVDGALLRQLESHP